MAETPLVEIYVSTNGVASGNGDSNNPVTLNKARELMYNQEQ